jgi:hypothetical protein
MKNSLFNLWVIFLFGGLAMGSCTGSKSIAGNKSRVAQIDLTHWKVTIPIVMNFLDKFIYIA